jgi:pilus assembly protein CpaD
MAQLRSFAALLVLGTVATACASSPGGPPANRSIYSLNQPVVQRMDYVLDVASSPDGVAASEQDRLAAWFQSLQLAYGDVVAIDQGGAYDDGKVREDIGEVAGRYGLLVAADAPVTAGEVPPGTVRIVVSRTTASVPGCPNWEGRDRLSSTSANYGCAINSNLSAMVADPNDLVLGQTGSGTSDPATATRAIRTHRNATPTGAGGLHNVNPGGR